MRNRGARPPVPPALADQVTVLGIPNARFWADTQGAALAAEGELALKRERTAAGEVGRNGELPPAYFLAVSADANDGAFGSGLLCGWSDAGTIPTFKLVTGVSTGAMIAPLAFPGRPYNDRLRALYDPTYLSARSITATPRGAPVFPGTKRPRLRGGNRRLKLL